MKKSVRNALSLVLVLALVMAMAGCGSSGGGQSGAAAGEQNENAAAQEDTSSQSGDVAGEESSALAPAAEGEKIVNVGVTDSLGGINPFVIDQTEINKYAVGLMFLPLVELDKDLNFQNMLADSITTEDNLNFIVHIDEIGRAHV